MTRQAGEQPPSGGRTPIDVPVITAEIADGAITPPHMAYMSTSCKGRAGPSLSVGAWRGSRTARVTHAHVREAHRTRDPLGWSCPASVDT
jgi:hypothetical protein